MDRTSMWSMLKYINPQFQQDPKIFVRPMLVMLTMENGTEKFFSGKTWFDEKNSWFDAQSAGWDANQLSTDHSLRVTRPISLQRQNFSEATEKMTGHKSTLALESYMRPEDAKQTVSNALYWSI